MGKWFESPEYETQKRKREKRRAEGLCVCCGKNRPEEGYCVCKTCLEQCRNFRNMRIQRRKEQRLCIVCGEPLAADCTTVRCKQCLEAKTAEDRARYAVLVEHKICARCHEKDAVEGERLCEDCREIRRRNANNRYSKRKEAGVCVICRCPLPEVRKQETTCEACAEKRNQKRRERYARYKAQGICVTCGSKKALPGFTRCNDCMLNHNQRISGYVEHTSAYINGKLKKRKEAERLAQ